MPDSRTAIIDCGCGMGDACQSDGTVPPLPAETQDLYPWADYLDDLQAEVDSGRSATPGADR